MKEVLCVGYVNGIELLKNGLECYLEHFDDIRIINNSLNPIDIPSYDNVTIIDIPVSLNTAQTVNWARHIALSEGFDVLWMPHHDMTITKEKVLSTKQNVLDAYNSGERWGAVFTLYDVFCAFNVEALNEVGGWDSLRFMYYIGDVDFYGRLVRSGWKIIEVGNDGVWHYGSGVIRENSERWFVVKRFADIEREIYIEKWKDDEDMRSRVEI
jgi:GT2 family glycosyltransferase